MKTTKTILAGLALIGALTMTGCVSSTQDMEQSQSQTPSYEESYNKLNNDDKKFVVSYLKYVSHDEWSEISKFLFEKNKTEFDKNNSDYQLILDCQLLSDHVFTGSDDNTQDIVDGLNSEVEPLKEDEFRTRLNGILKDLGYEVKDDKKEEKVEMGQCYDCGEMKPVKDMTFNGRSYHCGCADLDKAKEPVKDICPLSGKGDIPEHLKRDCSQFHEKEEKCKICGTVGTDVSNGICADCAAEKEQSENNEKLYGTHENEYYCDSCGGWFPTGTLCDCDM